MRCPVPVLVIYQYISVGSSVGVSEGEAVWTETGRAVVGPWVTRFRVEAGLK